VPAGIPGGLLGPPGPGEPLGRRDHDPVSAPLSAKAGYGLSNRIADREMTASERWDLALYDPADDAPDDPDPTPTARHRRAF
jgi:hypothetical protein